jgi:hypothetical protein
MGVLSGVGLAPSESVPWGRGKEGKMLSVVDAPQTGLIPSTGRLRFGSLITTVDGPPSTGGEREIVTHCY